MNKLTNIDGLINLCPAYRSSSDENKEKILSLLLPHIRADSSEGRYVVNYYALR